MGSRPVAAARVQKVRSSRASSGVWGVFGTRIWAYNKLMALKLGCHVGTASDARPASQFVSQVRSVQVCNASKSHKGRWAGMDAGNDTSDDQVRPGRLPCSRELTDQLRQGMARAHPARQHYRIRSYYLLDDQPRCCSHSRQYIGNS